MMNNQLMPFGNGGGGQGSATLSPLPDNRPRLAQVFSMLSVSTPSEAADTHSSANAASHANSTGRRLASTMPIPHQQLHQLSSFAMHAGDNDSDSDTTDSFTKSYKDPNQSTKAPLPPNYLLETTRDPRMPKLNFEHAQSKLNRIQRLSRFDRSFPKQLDKSFPIESPLSRFGALTIKKKVPENKSTEITSKLLINSDKEMPLPEKDTANKGPSAAAAPWPDRFEGSIGDSTSFADGDVQDKDGDGFDEDSWPGEKTNVAKPKPAAVLKYARSCALCTASFPKESIENRVLLKHITTIRTALDPELGNKFAAHLMQGLSPFNLVYVCGFCSQFFDPDADGGVIVPNVLKGAITDRHSAGAKPLSDVPKYFDDDYPDSMRLEGIAEDKQKFNAQMAESRARARSALEVARRIREAGTEEEERRLLREQIEAQIKAGFGSTVLRRASVGINKRAGGS